MTNKQEEKYKKARLKVYRDQITESFYKLDGDDLLQYPMDKNKRATREYYIVDFDEALMEMPIYSKAGKEINLYKHLKYIEGKLKGGK